MGPTSSTEPSPSGTRSPATPARYDEALRQRLLQVARTAIVRGLESGTRWVPAIEGEPRELREARGCFVTLHREGQLRGCVGSLVARGPVVQEVARAAFSAAFRDPRFVPLTAPELNGLDIHISVLSEPEPMTFDSEQDLLRQLRPGVDGLILEEGGRLGTFLPDVWEKLPSPEGFLEGLRRKAGLAPSYWSPTIRVQRYTTEAFS